MGAPVRMEFETCRKAFFETIGKGRRGPSPLRKPARTLLGQETERPVLGFVFGFNERISRLQYFWPSSASSTLLPAFVEPDPPASQPSRDRAT